MPGWICRTRNVENSFLYNHCKVCGQIRAAAAESFTSGSSLKSSIETLRSQNQSMLEGIRSNLSRSLDEISRTLERRGEESSLCLRSTSPDSPEAEAGEPLEEEDQSPYLASHAEISPNQRPANTGSNLELPLRQAGAPPFQIITNRELKLKVKALPLLNYSLVHCGLPLIRSLQINNDSKEALKNILIKAWVAPDYSEPWQKTIPDILPGKKHIEKKICLHLCPVWKKNAKVIKLVEATHLIPLSSTTFAAAPDKTFLKSREEGMRFILDSKVFGCGVDVISAHHGAAKPLP